MTDKEKKDLKIELKSRKLVLKKLETARRALEKTCKRIQNERACREAELSEYKNEDEIADAYGWGFMSEEEYDDLLTRFREGKEAIRNEKSSEEIAAEILSGWIRITEGDIESIRFDLLSDEKKEEIRQQNYEIAQRREERRKERDSISD